MGLNDFLKHKHHGKSSHHYHDNHHHEEYNDSCNDHNDHHSGHMGYHDEGHHHGSYKLELLRSALNSLPHKKAILTVALIACVLLLVIGAVFIWALFPLVTQAVGYVETNGIKGMVDSLLPYVDKLWKGNG